MTVRALLEDARLWSAGTLATSLLSVGGGLGATGVGAVPGFVGQLANAIGVHGSSTTKDAIFGGAIAVVSLVRIPGGVAIWKGEAWGFRFTGTLSLISMLLDLGHLAHHTGAIGLFLNAAIAGYCGWQLRRRPLNPKDL